MVTRLFTGSVATVLVGILTGFILSSAAGLFIQDSGVFGGSGESPVARAYMLGLLLRDPSSMSSVRPQQGPGSQGHGTCEPCSWGPVTGGPHRS